MGAAVAAVTVILGNCCPTTRDVSCSRNSFNREQLLRRQGWESQQQFYHAITASPPGIVAAVVPGTDTRSPWIRVAAAAAVIAPGDELLTASDRSCNCRTINFTR
jgi:hypothetical protein